MGCPIRCVVDSSWNHSQLGGLARGRDGGFEFGHAGRSRGTTAAVGRKERGAPFSPPSRGPVLPPRWPSSTAPDAWRDTGPPANSATPGCGSRRRGRCRRGRCRAPSDAGGAGEDEDGPARQDDDLVAGNGAGGVGTRVARAETHGPGVGKGERGDDGSEIPVVGVHACRSPAPAGTR